MADDLIAFITARLDEDEQVTERMRDAAWPVSIHVVPHDSGEEIQPSVSIEGHGGPKPFQRVWWPDGNVEYGWSLHDSAVEVWSEREAERRLRAVAAKRKILDAHSPTSPHADGTYDYPEAATLCGTCGPGDDWQAQQQPYGQVPCFTVRALATEYSDHPDYDETWSLNP